MGAWSAHKTRAGRLLKALPEPKPEAEAEPVQIPISVLCPIPNPKPLFKSR